MLARVGALEQRRAPPRDDEAGGASERGEEKALRQQLTNDPATDRRRAPAGSRSPCRAPHDASEGALPGSRTRSGAGTRRWRRGASAAAPGPTGPPGRGLSISRRGGLALRFVSGSACSSRRARTVISACASASVRPGLSRPMRSSCLFFSFASSASLKTARVGTKMSGAQPALEPAKLGGATPTIA